MRGVERRIAAEARVDRQRARDERRRHRPFRGEQSGQRERGRNLRSVQEREPFLRRKFDRLQARGRQRRGARQQLPVHARLAFADQHRRKVRERRQIARCADGSLPRNARYDARIGHADDQLDHVPANAGIAAGQRGRLERENEPHRRGVERRTRARAVRAHERALQLGQARVVDPRARKETESGIDAVNGLASEQARARRWRLPHRPQVARRDRGAAPDLRPKYGAARVT